MARMVLPPAVKKRVPTILAVVSTLAFAWLAINRLDLADRSFWTGVEMRALDAKFRIRGERPGGNDVLIVGIDDKTLDKLGSFRAFQRDRWAALISKLGAAGPKAIGFDITFNDVTEPSKDQEF